MGKNFPTMMKSIYQKLISNLNFPIEKLRTSLARALLACLFHWLTLEALLKRPCFLLGVFLRLCPESPAMPHHQQGDCLHPRLQSLLDFSRPSPVSQRSWLLGYSERTFLKLCPVIWRNNFQISPLPLCVNLSGWEEQGRYPRQRKNISEMHSGKAGRACAGRWPPGPGG